jgi:arginine deiminase
MPHDLSVHSEIGTLRTVMLHRPGEELLNLSPDSLGRLLFDDIPYLAEAQREHDAFAQMLRDEGVEVLYLDKLTAEAIDACPEGRELFVDRYVDECGLDGCDALQDLVREVLLSQRTTEDLVRKAITGIRADEAGVSPSRMRSLADRLNANGSEEDGLLVDPIPNIYFTRDSFTVLGSGVSINRMLSVTRRRETLLGETVFTYHPAYKETQRWYSRDLPYHIEGGDILILGNHTLAVGISERTQSAAVDVLAKTVLWGGGQSDIDRVFALLIPRKRAFMHLDTVFTQLDVDTFTMHPAILGTLRVFELTRGAHTGEVVIRQREDTIAEVLAQALGLDGVRLIKCGGDDAIAATREQWNDGSNTLAVSPGRVFVYQRNQVTNDILYKEGFELLEIPSGELSRGRGGPHCMSMPFARDAV